MKFTVEDLSTVKKIVHVEIPEDVVTEELNKAYKELKKTAKVKGFRPGKAPRTVLERVYKQEVKADVASKLIQESVFKAVLDAGLKIVAPPRIDPPELEDQKPYLYDATVETNPEIADIDFKGLSLTKNLYETGDMEVETQLKMIQRNFATQKPIEENRPVRDKDFVLIDYEGFKDGAPFADTRKTENFTLKIGAGTILKAFDDQLIGMTIGESREFSVSFPEDYFNPALSGLNLSFQVSVKEIREEILPEINDDLARKMGAFETLDDVKKLIRDNVQDGYERRAEQEMSEQIFTALIEKTAFEVPDALVDMELEGIISETEQSLKYQNMSLEDLGMTRENLAEKYRDVAEKQVRRHLILGKIMDQEKLELSDEDLEKGIDEMAKTVRQPVEQIKKFYQSNPDKMDVFKHTLLEKQVLRLIVSHSTVENVVPQAETKPSELVE
jgi:trigger factor